MPRLEPPLAPPSSPRRNGGHKARPPRRRTHLKGLLVYGNGLSTLDCAIHDISDGGAKAVIAQGHALPLDLYLIVVKLGIAHHAKIVWRKYPARGLQFFEAYSLRKPLPPEVTFLDGLWVDPLAGRAQRRTPVSPTFGIC
jgi:hypothetical protein